MELDPVKPNKISMIVTGAVIRPRTLQAWGRGDAELAADETEQPGWLETPPRGAPRRHRSSGSCSASIRKNCWLHCSVYMLAREVAATPSLYAPT